MNARHSQQNFNKIYCFHLAWLVSNSTNFFHINKDYRLFPFCVKDERTLFTETQVPGITQYMCI